MPTNLKKLILARRAKTGESRQTAVRHVRGQQPPDRFETLVRRIIRMANEWLEEHDTERRNRGSRGADYIVHKILHEPIPPREKALWDALLAMSEGDLRKVEVLFYAGEPGNDESIYDVARFLRRESHEITAHHLSRKLWLPRCLGDGLVKAACEGVNLEGPFPSPARGKLTPERRSSTSAPRRYTYWSTGLDDHGMPRKFASYKVLPAVDQPVAGYTTFGVIPTTDTAQETGVAGSRVCSVPLPGAWDELEAFLDAAHPGLRRHITDEGSARL